MTLNPSQPYDVTVIGLGYIGLPTAAFFAASGLKVYGYDINPSLVNSVQQGKAPFAEPGFESFLSSTVESGNLKAGTNIQPAKAYILAVPTPLQPDRKADVSFVFDAATSLAPRLCGGDLVIVESTCPPGLTEDITNHILQSRPDLTLTPKKPNSLYVAHAPERVLPGKIMSEMKTNDRIVGGVTPESAKQARQLYESFCAGEVLVTDSRTAEMTKLAENSFRDVNIAFANELSLICDDLGIDVWELISLANRHPRVNILQPGPGVGGHCIAVDPWFIVEAAADSARLIKTSREVNGSKPQRVIDKVSEKVNAVESASGKLNICILGITFKPDIDDIRESPALQIAETIARTYTNASISIVEPNLDKLPKPLTDFPNVTQVALEDGIANADVAVVLVDHTLFKEKIQVIAQHQCLIDTRGILNGR
ncbi:UDP-N-acetyl-D-mannosaminuronic acid dehydrogenase [Corynebacterium sp. HMSC036E10]|uniref:UDP-N-acetyl-D-mannosamine dehydrogenase n=1 Tax=Corynebacterium sp. HMSC036E10 TaxID=1715215 RepID=UPI0008A84736|nr:UDP-N-acetyl-D-mannosamine dehydrogenase [Corynebacterium sp. HMSC036E10]OHO81442.1 UDP-N-acetyl-D-mannosaminuronic acid dehydrogenase [Corynebacterium sp. HMSC036E10]